MEGFFSKKQTQSKTRPDGKVYSCASCGLVKNCENPKIQASGNFRKGILCIGEATNSWDDRKNKQWQGKDGKLLKSTLSSFGIDLWEDCMNINAVNCLTLDENNEFRFPNNYEIDCCRRSVMKLIEELQPKLILLFGISAVYSVIGNRWKKDLGGIMKWRGFCIPDRELKSFVCPVFSPNYVMNSEREVVSIWKRDLKQALFKLDHKFPRFKNPNINYIKDLSELNDIKNSLVAFDYETTGLKPHAIGHRIICASVAVDINNVYSFLIPEKRKDCVPFLNLLKNNEIGKMAHNMKFEDTWTAVRLKTQVNYWAWDSMQAAHVLDNRPGVTGLKFQTYVNFGVIDYSSEIEPYLKGVERDNGNSLNNIKKLLGSENTTKELLKYCALDSIYEYRLAIKQMKQMDYSFLPF